jgi:nitric oxide reductase NorD protein
MRTWLKRFGLGANQRRGRDNADLARLTFPQVESALVLYVKALSDSRLRVMSSGLARQGSYSDGRTIFVPPEIDIFPSEIEARRLYRVMSAWKVLQVKTGALSLDRLPDPKSDQEALLLYEVISGEWLDRTMASTWPGLATDLAALRSDALRRRAGRDANRGHGAESLLRALLTLPLDRPLREADLVRVGDAVPEPDRVLLDMVRATRDLLHADRPDDSLRLATEFARQNGASSNGTPPPAVHYRGRIRPDMLKPPDFTAIEDLAVDQSTSNGNSRRRPPRSAPLQIEGRVPPPPRKNRFRGPTGGRQSVQLSLADRDPVRTFQQVELTEQEKAGAHLYREWDHTQGIYLPEWCALRTRRPRGGSADSVERILRQHAALIRHIKQQFEALRPERLRLSAQLDGDDIDLGSYVEAYADRRAGLSASEKLYSRMLEKERNIALACLIDLSGSTGAWIDDDPRNEQVIEVTRRAIVFLCEALSVLDDRHAVYGFTGSTRKHCELSVVKGFDESYGETIKGRIAGLGPGSYTRMGPAIRHTARNLVHQPARVRILMLITDGRPNDFDGYGGRYGIEDTRKALIEARQMGVSAFAVTIDGEARDYMPYMFGPGHYIVVEDTPALATKLSDVYRRLTIQ